MTQPSPNCPRTALIGVSGYGRVHLQLARAAHAAGRMRLRAAVVINADEESALVDTLKAEGCAIYSDYESMFAAEKGRLDLCLVPTGIHWHARMTIAALEGGANVLVEKPLCASPEEAAAIAEAEQRTGKFVAVGFQDYYEPGTRWLKRQLSQGAIGEVKSVRFLGVWPRARRYFDRNGWAGCLQVEDQPVFDSPLNNAFAHFVMLSLYFAARSEDDAAAAEVLDAELFRTHRIESFDTGVVRSRTRDGVELWFGASHASTETIEPLIEIHGTKGSACWSYENEAWLQDDSGNRRHQPLMDVGGAREEMLGAVLRRIMDADERVCTPHLASQHTRFIADLHNATTIENMPAEEVEWSEGDPENANAIPSVRGLVAALRAAHSAGCSLREAGVREFFSVNDPA